MADYEDNKQKNSFTLFNNETGKSYDLPVIKFLFKYFTF